MTSKKLIHNISEVFVGGQLTFLDDDPINDLSDRPEVLEIV